MKRKAEDWKAKEVRFRRLKNERREEMKGRLRKVQYILGESYEAAYAANEERGGGVSAIYEAALMKLMEGKYDPKNFEKIIGGAYGIEYYGEEDMQWKTDVMEAERGYGGATTTTIPSLSIRLTQSMVTCTTNTTTMRWAKSSDRTKKKGGCGKGGGWGGVHRRRRKPRV